jgi:hypothetical protein
MSRLSRNRGQVILVMSITLITIILLVSTIIYLTSTQHLFFNYNPSREIVMSIDSDFNRVLTRILANATATYNMTSEMDSPRRNASLTFTYWTISTQAAYTGKGLNIQTQMIDDPVQEAKSIMLTLYKLTHQGEPDYSNPANHVFNYPERRLENRLFKLFWYRPNSISAIGAEISVDATFQGVVGWRATHIVLLNLTITSIVPDEKNGLLHVNVIVLRENGFPVNDLKTGNFEVYLFDPTVPPGVYCWRRITPGEMTLIYNGGGNYNITITPSFYNPESSSVDLFWRWGQQPGYYQFILVRVQDNRGIIVESYSYAGIEYAIRENAVEPFYAGDPSKIKETYVFELIPNGTMYWYNTKLSAPTDNPPIPLPPVKQVRLMATRNGDPTSTGYDPSFYEVPYQTEVWDDRYLWPNSESFLDWRRRIMNGSKIVFELNYPQACRLQKVMLTWLEDADATPPDFRLHMYYNGSFAIVNNEKYILTLLAMPTSYWVDWSISLQDPRSNTHVEYVLLGYDVYPIYVNGTLRGWWFPRKLPADDWTLLPKPVNKSGTLVVEAPVRIVAFRKSNRTQERPPEGPVSYDEMHYETLLYIPYNVSYFLYVANATWLKSVHMDYAYLSLMGMVGGTDKDFQSSLRVNWGSFATSVANPSIVNGSYSNIWRTNIMHRDRNNSPANIPSAQAYGNWTVLYNEYAGMAIFASEDFIDELRSYFIGNTRMDQLWVWTTYDFQRRVMEYDAIYWRRTSTPTYDTDTANKIQFKVAGFLTEGGKAVTPFVNASLWYNGTDRNALPFRTVESTNGTVAGELVLAKRNAFIYDDFSTDPFSGRLVTNTGAWSWNSTGYIQVSADGPSGSWGGAHVAHYLDTTPPTAGTIYLLSKQWYSTTQSTGQSGRQGAGLAMINSQSSFYTLEFYYDGNTRRLGVWYYDGIKWDYSNRNSSSLSPPTWFISLGSRNINTGATRVTVYNTAGSLVPRPLTADTDPSVWASQVGLSIFKEKTGYGILTARFDDFVACIDADPRFVNVSGLTPGWTVVLKDENGAIVASAQANSRGVASLNVITRPIVKKATIEIYSGATFILSKPFDVVVGGDVYKRTVVGSVKNAVEECLMYYRMFLNRFAPSITSVAPVYREP